MKIPIITLLAVLVLAPTVVADRNVWLDAYIEKYSVTFPKEYLVIVDQPVGIVQRFIIFDLESGDAHILPGSHARRRGWQPRKGESLNDENHQFLRRFLSELAREIPGDNGKLGLDGGSLVAYYKIGDTERFISHWQPDHIGLYMLDGVLSRYYTRRLIADFDRAPKEGEQAGTGQPATRPESDSEGSEKPQPESEGRSR